MAKVIIYTTSWCPHCEMLRKFLRMNKIKYTEYDVEENNAKWKEGLKKSGGKDVVPIIDIDGKILMGNFNDVLVKQLKRALKL